MDKNCGNTNLETFLPDKKGIYVPSKEERQLGDFGYADEDDPRKLGWCGEAIDEDEQDIVVENHGTRVKKVTEKELDDYANQPGHTYFEAYNKHFNVTPADIEWEPEVIVPKKVNQAPDEKIEPRLDAEDLEDIKSDVEPGPSVNLDDRHLAIKALMKIYNIQNKVQGAHLRGFDRLVDKYGNDDASRMVINMDRNSETADGQIDNHIDTLTATAALKDAGYNMNDIMNEKEALRYDLQHHYGPGNAHFADREKLVRKVRPPQDKVRHSHKNIADAAALPY